MPRLQSDVSGGGLTEGPGGYEAERVFMVFDLDGTAEDQLFTAITFPGIPDRGDPYPSIPSLVCTDKECTPEDGRSAKVTCTYARPNPENSPQLAGQEQRITMDSSIIQRDEYFDINNVRISATYTGGIGTVTHWPKATVTQNIVTLTITTRETVTETDIIRRSLTYNDSVNDATWFGWAARTWKIDDISMRPGDNEGFLVVDHVLSYRADTWRFLATYITEGRVPPDATEGDGFQRWDIRELQDFSLLPITVPTP